MSQAFPYDRCACGNHVFIEDKLRLKEAKQSAPGNYIINGVTRVMSIPPLFLKCANCGDSMLENYARPQKPQMMYKLMKGKVI